MRGEGERAERRLESEPEWVVGREGEGASSGAPLPDPRREGRFQRTFQDTLRMSVSEIAESCIE